MLGPDRPLLSIYAQKTSPPMARLIDIWGTTFWHVHPMKTQISLRIRAVWSEFLLSALGHCILGYLNCPSWRFWSESSLVAHVWKCDFWECSSSVLFYTGQIKWSSTLQIQSCKQVSWFWITLRKRAYPNILKISPPKTGSFQIKILIYFCSKHRLWVLVRNASPMHTPVNPVLL